MKWNGDANVDYYSTVLHAFAYTLKSAYAARIGSRNEISSTSKCRKTKNVGNVQLFPRSKCA